MSDETKEARRFFGGSPQCTEDNMTYCLEKIQQLNRSGTKMTFRQWINKMMILFDLID